MATRSGWAISSQIRPVGAIPPPAINLRRDRAERLINLGFICMLSDSRSPYLQYRTPYRHLIPRLQEAACHTLAVDVGAVSAAAVLQAPARGRKDKARVLSA